MVGAMPGIGHEIEAAEEGGGDGGVHGEGVTVVQLAGPGGSRVRGNEGIGNWFGFVGSGHSEIC